MRKVLNGLFVYDIKAIEKALMNPQEFSLAEIRQLKREYIELKKKNERLKNSFKEKRK